MSETVFPTLNGKACPRHNYLDPWTYRPICWCRDYCEACRTGAEHLIVGEWS